VKNVNGGEEATDPGDGAVDGATDRGATVVDGATDRGATVVDGATGKFFCWFFFQNLFSITFKLNMNFTKQ
jgi:hypothetical protein